MAMAPWYWGGQVHVGGPGFEFELARSRFVWAQFPAQLDEQVMKPAFKLADRFNGQGLGQDQHG
jgi:hypothetical protein